MGSIWLPTWLGALCTVGFVVILVVHVAHAMSRPGWSRLWHGGHILMALGMIDMFWPAVRMPVGATVGEGVFAVAALGFLIVGVLPATRRSGPPWLWVIQAVDLAVMVYMFAMMSRRVVAVTVLLALWLLLESAGWASGLLTTVATHEDLIAPDDPQGELASESHRRTTEDDRSVTPRQGGASLSKAGAATSLASSPPLRHGSGHALSLRITLAAMSLGMAYMLLAMQFGISAMGSMTPGGGSMPGMPGMPGM
jgi:hypothetical protein